MVVGGYASMLLGSDLLTQDLDICVKLTAENLHRIYDAVEDLDPRNRMHPQRLEISREMATSRTVNNLYFVTTMGPLDCLGNITGLGDYAEVMKYSKAIDLSFGSISILYFEGLIKAKSVLNRDKDRQTIQKLRAIQEYLDAMEDGSVGH